MDLHQEITIHPRVKSGGKKILISLLLPPSIIASGYVDNTGISIFPILILTIFTLPALYYLCSGIWDIISSFRKEHENISSTFDTTTNTRISPLLQSGKTASVASILIMGPVFFLIGSEFFRTLGVFYWSDKLALIGPCTIIGILSILFYIFSSKIDVSIPTGKLLVYLQISGMVYIIYRAILLLSGL